MNIPSKEQLYIINQLQSNNIIIDSVAGSGKTTTNLHIAKKYNNKNILLLTYNTKLKLETRQKVLLYNINNIDVHSYHSFCVKYYYNKCYNDDAIIYIINKKLKPQITIKYNILILDEAQDICPLYYELILKIIYNNTKLLKICILGDKYQSIYNFNNADSRYITMGTKLFNINNYNWITTNLSISFRLTKQIANFINDCFLNEKRINTIKEGPKPRYIICDTFGSNSSNRCYAEVLYYLERYNYEDIFILAPSVKSEKSPVRQLANILSKNNIPIYVPLSDEEKIDDDIIKGKITFSTYHQSKGLERKVVIIYGIDESYFLFYKKNSNELLIQNEFGGCTNINIPNEIYVALTRSLEQLTLFHHYDYNYINFINNNILNKYCYCEDYKFKIKNKKRLLKNNIVTPVTNLIKHLPINIINDALLYIDVSVINESEEIIDIPIKTKQQDLYENVCEITGTAIPSYFEYILLNKMEIYNKLIENNLLDIRIDIFTVENLLFIANKWNAFISGYNYKIYQINNYDWLSVENLNICINRLKQRITKNAIFEIKYEKELFNRKIIGYIDCIDEYNIYEFKCVKKLEKEHYLQLACYMYLFSLTNNINNYNFYLMNILDNKLLKIESSNEKLNKLINLLIYEKYINEVKKNDINFINDNIKIFNKYFID
jgi:hypothetical protein